jgi:hypothetical protein
LREVVGERLSLIARTGPCVEIQVSDQVAAHDLLNSRRADLDPAYQDNHPVAGPDGASWSGLEFSREPLARTAFPVACIHRSIGGPFGAALQAEFGGRGRG